MSAVLSVLAVALGGALGALARWGMALLSLRAGQGQEVPGMPWPTFLANIAACLLIGMAAVLMGSSTSLLPQLGYLLLGTGIAGGLSTLSTFALEVINLVRRGAVVIALAYALLSAGAGMAALWLGVVIAA